MTQIDWSHLPFAISSAVCWNPGATAGWSRDPKTGYFTCAEHNKPSYLVAVRICDVCEKTFIPQFYQKIQDEPLLGILCDECDPPKSD